MVVPSSSSAAPLITTEDAALKAAKHSAFTFDGTCAALAYFTPRRQAYESKGLLPGNSQQVLASIKSMLTSVACAHPAAAGDADALLEEWAAAHKFRKQRNHVEAHPLSNEFADELVEIFKQAVTAEHPCVKPFVHVAKEAAAAAETELQHRLQMAELEEQQLGQLRKLQWW